VVVFRGEDGLWVAECLSLPGCVSQGRTREEAVGGIREAIRLYVGVLEEDRLPVPEERFDTLLVAVCAASLPFWARLCSRAWKAGFRVRRQEGSHIVLRRDDPYGQVVVPDHKELDRGTLRAILRGAGVEVEDFIALLGKFG
jgi:predicted RNase H-like HicB family nuclease/predicted RNA binding protein YcfA (HicA-like mRNA interferase family)